MELEDLTGTPITGVVVTDATIALGKCATPGPGNNYLDTAAAGTFRILYHSFWRTVCRNNSQFKRNIYFF